MAGGRNRGRGRRTNRQHSKKKGPQAPVDERLWRRVSQHFQAEDWLETWTAEAITAMLVDKEHLAAQFRSEPKRERALLSSVNEALAHGRSEGTYILPEEGKTVRFRSPSSLETLQSAVAGWKDFFRTSRRCGCGQVRNAPGCMGGHAHGPTSSRGVQARRYRVHLAPRF